MPAARSGTGHAHSDRGVRTRSNPPTYTWFERKFNITIGENEWLAEHEVCVLLGWGDADLQAFLEQPSDDEVPMQDRGMAQGPSPMVRLGESANRLA